jgi:hypothetical protein
MYGSVLKDRITEEDLGRGCVMEVRREETVLR